MLDDYMDLVLEALKDCTDAQASAYMATHGIRWDGTTDPPMSLTAAAEVTGAARRSLQTNLAYAERKVYRHICLTLIRREQSRQRAERIFPGTSTIEAQPRYARSEDTIHLGAATVAYTSAAKRTDGVGSSTIDIHQRYCTPATPHTGQQLLHRIWGVTTR